MLQFSKVSKAYGERTLFKEASFVLSRGERVAIVGRNGTGKSTLFRLITGEESSDAGDIILPKHYRIGTLQQHIQFSEPTIIGEAMLSLPLDERDQEYRAEIILMGLGFALEEMQRNPNELSGGYQLRLQLTKVLLSEPDCLLLDEPTNYLDIVAIRWLEEFLQRWPSELMLVSHDRSFLDNVCTHTLGLYRQQIQKVRGNTEKFYTQMLQQDEIHDRTQERMEKKRAHLQSYIDRFGAKATKAAQAQSRAKQIEKMPVLQRLANMNQLDFAFREARFPGRRMLEVDDMQFSYDAPAAGSNEPFGIHDVSVHIEKGDRLAIIGKNGRGKSTLLRLLAGQLKSQEGDWWISENLRIGYFGQTHIQRLNLDLTVEQEISNANPQLTIGEVRAICGLMMFSGDLAKKAISVLSGGERSRVLLGKIIATPCNMLLLDEPTHHLDMESVEALLGAVKDFPGSVILVTHDENVLKQFGDRMLICKEGSVRLFDGDYSRFLEVEGWEPEDEKPKKKVKTPKPQKNPVTLPKQRIKKCEDDIVAAEAQLTEAEKLLQQAADTGKLQAMDTQSKAVSELQAKIDALFAELETLHEGG